MIQMGENSINPIFFTVSSYSIRDPFLILVTLVIKDFGESIHLQDGFA